MIRTLALLIVLLIAPLRVRAQEARIPEIPRTRTFSGLVAPAFPYARPEEVFEVADGPATALELIEGGRIQFTAHRER